jgi:hypothetical protein
MNERMISAPWSTDPYEEQQKLEMCFCENCKHQMNCKVYGMPYNKLCQDLQEFNHEKNYS